MKQHGMATNCEHVPGATGRRLFGELTEYLLMGKFMDNFYWKRHPEGKFATLIRITTTYLHPEADDLESLQRLTGHENDAEMCAFKAELRAAIKDPGQLPDDELSEHVRYEEGSPGAFLRRLWLDLYGKEPVDMPED